MKIKNHVTNRDNNNSKKNSFKDFYDAYAKPYKKQSETSKNQKHDDTKEIAATVDEELKKTNEIAQEVLSMMKWSQA